MTPALASRTPVVSGQASSVLALAGHLSTLHRHELEALLQGRLIAQPNRVHDTFDLAESLLKPESIRQALTELTWQELQALTSLDFSAEATRDRLLARALVMSVDAQTEPIPEVDAALHNLLQERGLTAHSLTAAVVTAAVVTSASKPAGPATSDADSQDDVTRSAVAERAFECVRVASHIMRLVAAHPLAVRNGQSLTSSALQQVAGATGVSSDLVTATVEMLVACGAAAFTPTQLSVSWAVHDWHTWSRPQRYVELAHAWLRAQPEGIRAALSGSTRDASGSVTQQFTTLFPLATASHLAQLTASLRVATEVGLVADDRLTWLGALLVSGSQAEAGAELADRFPAAVPSFYVQPDLSIIAPGPLELGVEDTLLRFAELESAGLASSYRVAARTLEAALDEGMTEDDIRSFLAEHSRTGIPQPLDYLLSETSRRHRNILVRDTNATPTRRTTITVAESALLTQLLVDRALKPLALTALSDTTAGTLLDADTVTRLIRDAGYPASHEATAERIGDARDVGDAREARDARDVGDARNAPATLDAPTAQLLERIVAQATETDDTGALERLLQYAVRHKQRIRVVLNQPDGQERAFVLRPVSLKNGRLRGIDEAAEVERTLPIDQLSAVEQVREESR